MKLTKKILNEHGIHNPHNLASKVGNKLYVGYEPADTGRAGHSAKWQVIGINFATDPKAHWTDYGNKTFGVWTRRDKELQLTMAIQWVKEKYNIDITDKDPFGAWHPSGTLKKLEALIKKEQGDDDNE